MRRTMRTWTYWTACLGAAALLAGCGSGDKSTDSASKSETAAPATATPDMAAALGTENKATGSPIDVGLLNLESGPVTFPEYSQAAKAAVSYINDYKGGIAGHPGHPHACAAHAQPPTPGRCAGPILGQKPAVILR